MNTDTPLQLSPSDIGKIVEQVAEKVGKEVSNAVDVIDRTSRDLTGHAIDNLPLDELAPLTPEIVKSLAPLLDDLNGFVNAVGDGVGLDHLKSLAELPGSLDLVPLRAFDVDNVLGSMKVLIETLESMAPPALHAMATRTTLPLKNTLAGLQTALHKLPDDAWEQLRFPRGLVDLNGAARQLDEIADQIEDTVRGAGGANATPSSGERRLILAGAATSLNLLADLFGLLGEIFPAGVTVGGNGGLAAGANVTAAIRLQLLKLGKLPFGGLQFLAGSAARLVELLNQAIDDPG